MNDSPGWTTLRCATSRFAAGTLIFGVLVSLFAAGCKKQGGAEAIVVGSKNFTEQIILAE
jgi:glycine betaine/choline ABC-type transport system substrate-binding protein